MKPKADVVHLRTLISAANLWKCEYGSAFAVFPTVIIFPSSTLFTAVRTSNL